LSNPAFKLSRVCTLVFIGLVHRLLPTATRGVQSDKNSRIQTYITSAGAFYLCHTKIKCRPLLTIFSRSCSQR